MQFSRSRQKDPINYFCDIVRAVKRDVTHVREFKSSCYRMRSLFMYLPPGAARLSRAPFSFFSSRNQCNRLSVRPVGKERTFVSSIRPPCVFLSFAEFH